MKSEVYFVIPAYNEAKVISKVLQDLIKNGYKKLIVIDDHSSDETYEISKKFAHVIRHNKNKGQGAALRTGIKYALRQKSCKYIVTYDSDGQHRIEDLPDLLAPIKSGKYDVSLGSRFLGRKNKIPFTKWVILRLSLLFTLLISHVNLTDTHNGYRVFNRKAAKAITIRENCMAHASEIIDEIGIKKLRYKEVPVVIRYDPYAVNKHNLLALGKRSFSVAYKMLIRKLTI